MTSSALSGLKLATEEARKMEIMDPVTGLPLQAPNGETAFLMLFSNDSPKATAFDRKVTDGRLKQRQRPTAEELENEQLQRLGVLTDSWMLVNLDGEPIDFPCNPKNAMEVYREIPWIAEQALDFIRGRVNYKKS